MLIEVTEHQRKVTLGQRMFRPRNMQMHPLSVWHYGFIFFSLGFCIGVRMNADKLIGRSLRIVRPV